MIPARLLLFVRENVRDARRERQLYLLAGLFALVGAGVAYLVSGGGATGPGGVEVDVVAQVFDPLTFLIPLAALGFVAPALAQQRSSGALTVVLGLPFTRRTVVLGTFLGRSAVLGAAVLAATLAALVVGVATGAAADPAQFAIVSLLLVCLAVTFTAIAVAISAMVRTSTQATVAAFGAFVVFALGVWGNLPMLALYLLHGLSYPDTIPSWVDVVRSLNPMDAFSNGVAGVRPSLVGGAPAADPAFFERPSFAFCVLLLWIVGTVGLGYRRFRATDL